MAGKTLQKETLLDMKNKNVKHEREKRKTFTKYFVKYKN